jgi:uncharacterized protein YbjT (DUF2867 family)
VSSTTRRALIAGASGLVGRELLTLLAADGRWSAVHLLLRRPLPSSARPPRDSPATLHEHVLDFDSLGRYPDFPAVDDVFVCLGTTIGRAGSREAFRRVDFDLVVAIARLALRGGAQRLAAITAMGADPGSRFFYNRVKGDVEAALAGLGYPSTTILRPSLLAGERLERRPGERIALALLRPVAPLLSARWRPVPAAAVARAMRDAVARGAPGLRIVESDLIRRDAGVRRHGG